MPLVTTRVRAIATAGTAALLCAGAIAAASPGQASPRSAIPNTHPSWASSAQQVSAQTVTTGTVSARVYLAGQDPAGLAAYAQAVSTPGNASYGQYLTPAEVQQRFGPTSDQIDAIRSWLTGAGLTVTSVVDKADGYIAVAGSVSDAAKAFSVTFRNYRGPDKRTDRAPAQAATAPASVSDAIVAVTGLDTASHQMRPTDTLPPPPSNYWTAGPCSQYYGQKIATSEPAAYGKHQPWTNCGYTPAQVRSAYGVTASGMTGQGQTVAIVDAYASPSILSDANEFSTTVGDKPFASGQFHQYLPASFNSTDACGAASWYPEETLDVESVHGEAQNANVNFVAGASCNDSDLLAAEAFIVNDHIASIVSNSFGDPSDLESIAGAYDQVFEIGATEGIGFFFSSGDSGYESPDEDPGVSDQIQTDYPAESPWVTAVGGTSLAIGPAKNYEFETSWGTMNDELAANGKSWSSQPPGTYPADYDGSSGGGVSTLYSQPAYQRNVVPRSLATHLPNGTVSATPMRVEPDVAALADPSTGILIGETTLQPDGTTYAFSLSRTGGTSVAAPTFAGVEADAQQAAGHDLGFANPAIYQRYRTAAFHDVTDHPLGPGYLAEVRQNYTDPSTKAGPLLTYLRTLGVDGEGAAALPAVTGYDDATGVGSPKLYVQSFERH
ncbi:MAG TPA: S53 family peptidase [Streptosporangiaceae bacterium]|nr:S53 family peptidase [Streptosporangiaceae bacterium]